jgi:hypothetical protein
MTQCAIDCLDFFQVPTSDDYAILLNMPPSVAGIMIGAMPITALVSTFVYR